MSLAIREEHAALAAATRRFLEANCPSELARAALDAEEEARPPFWPDAADMGWFGLPVDYGLEEAAIVVEELARGGAPGPFLATMAAVALIGASADPEAAKRWLPGLVDGTLVGAVTFPSVAPLVGSPAGIEGVLRPVMGGGLADVVVVNHHLFFADLALRTSSAGDAGAAVLPRYDAVIFDEAHAVEEVATENFGVQLGSFRVGELGRDAARVLAGRAELSAARDLAARLGTVGRAFFEAASRCRPAAKGRPWGGERSAGESDRWPIPPGSLDPAEPEREALIEVLRALAAQISGSADEEVNLLERRCSTLAAELSLFGRRSAGALRSDIEYDEGEAPPQERTDVVLWGESRLGHLFLHASPLDVASILQDRLYDRIGPVVFTSATLAVDGSLDFFARRVGLADAEGPLFPLDVKVLPSPFDYRQNAALYVPRTMPDPLEDGFAEAVADELREGDPCPHGLGDLQRPALGGARGRVAARVN